MKDINRIAVLGAGEMGHGIAEVAALAGYDVAMRDISEELVEKGRDKIEWSLNKLTEREKISEELADSAIQRIETFVDLEESVVDADFVIEAAPEDIDLKKKLFSRLDELCPEHVILATNTSGVSVKDPDDMSGGVSRMAESTERPEKVVGMHFFNPPVMMDLVEVVYGEDTADETVEVTKSLTEDLGKTPIIVEQDIRSFLVNSILGPFMYLPRRIVEDGEATIREIDSALVHKNGFPMGPFELQDLTGLDVGFEMAKERGQWIPNSIEEKVESGHLGRKTGKGWYDYEEGEGADYSVEDGIYFDTTPILSQIINVAAKMLDDGVASREDIDKGMKLGTGWPKGPLRWADELGIDNVVEALEVIREKHDDESFEPHPSLRKMVEENKTGKLAGEGFYKY